jgi:pseudaminic acid cytidylyltransferase
MRNIAIIPARGGSKRIPGKNIKHFKGLPIISYSIKVAIESKLFDYVMVSTDDDEIAMIAKSYGAEVPFFRSQKNADDFATTSDVIDEVLVELEGINMDFQFACCIYPTAPLLNVKYLLNGYQMINSREFKTVFPVCEYSYPIQRALRISSNYASMFWPENETTRSQDFDQSYHDAGQFYWLEIASFKINKKMLTNQSGVIILDEYEVQDIDNEVDWKIAELKYEYLQGIK